MTVAAPLLDLRGLSIRPDGAPRNLVDDLSLRVMPGETLCVVGESGCGKSLSVLALMGLLSTPPLRVTGGEARFEGSWKEFAVAAIACASGLSAQS